VARRLIDRLDAIVAMLVILAMAGIVTTISEQVFLRYALNSSFDWAEEVSRLLFVWSIFLAIPLGVKQGAHVGIDLLTSHWPPSASTALFRVTSLIGIALMGVVAWQAAILTRDQWDEPMTTLDFSIGLFMLPLAIGAAHAILHLLIAAIDGAPRKKMIVE
jgi:TRAP-type C4-dicarboxylate transport system permease small subunit